ncbi:MAG: hypothetical protein SNJ64_02875 [Endomicrobiia bacterium]
MRVTSKIIKFKLISGSMFNYSALVNISIGEGFDDFSFIVRHKGCLIECKLYPPLSPEDFFDFNVDIKKNLGILSSNKSIYNMILSSVTSEAQNFYKELTSKV